MITFMPYPSFASSLQVLDNKRLGKQRIEAHQLLRCLRGETTGWANHPAATMWRGYEPALALYMNEAILQWEKRGFKNTMWMDSGLGHVQMPWWMGDEAFHASHRSNLLRKDYGYYSQFGWTEGVDLPYIWPKP